MGQSDGPATHRPSRWLLAVLAVSAPLLVTLCVTIWRTPMSLSEAIALFEDVATLPPSRFFHLDTSYYRPLYHFSPWAIWHHAGSLGARLAWVRVLQIVPVIALVVLFFWHLRPRTGLEAAVSLFAAAVLVGSPGFRDNPSCL